MLRKKIIVFKVEILMPTNGFFSILCPQLLYPRYVIVKMFHSIVVPLKVYSRKSEYGSQIQALNIKVKVCSLDKSRQCRILYFWELFCGILMQKFW